MAARLAGPLLMVTVAFLMAVAILWRAGSRQRGAASVADMEQHDDTIISLLVLALFSLALFFVYVFR